MGLLKCKRCGRYTLTGKCGCGGEAVDPAPAPFSWPDRHWKERLRARGAVE